MENFDAIVIGGSVSGAPTAMLLSRLGHKVLLIEKSVFPRDTNSTHFIWPRGMSYLNRWGLADHILGSTPHYRNMEINIEGISLVGFVPLEDLRQRFIKLHGNDDGIIDYYCGPRRYFLDEYLLNAAKRSGVDVREGVSFKETIVEKDRVIGVVAQNSRGESFSATAKILIGADGRFSKFAKNVGAKDKDYRELSTFAYSYSQAELKYFYSIKDNKELVNQLISQFGDTLPINAGIEAQLLPEVEYPDFIQEFDSNSYSNSFPITERTHTLINI